MENVRTKRLDKQFESWLSLTLNNLKYRLKTHFSDRLHFQMIWQNEKSYVDDMFGRSVTRSRIHFKSWSWNKHKKFENKFSNIICKIWPIQNRIWTSFQTQYGGCVSATSNYQLTLWGQPHERKEKEIQKYQSFPLYSLWKSQVLVNLCITLL
jgi:hypothetical protein